MCCTITYPDTTNSPKQIITLSSDPLVQMFNLLLSPQQQLNKVFFRKIEQMLSWLLLLSADFYVVFLPLIWGVECMFTQKVMTSPLINNVTAIVVLLGM